MFFYKSPIGTLKIQLKNNQVYSISQVSGKKKTSCLSEIKWENKQSLKLAQDLVFFLDNYFLKNKLVKRKWPLFSFGSSFQERVWNFLRQIPCGQTRTYSEVAKAVGSTGAARAVGSACAKNPYLILVPCHRVVSKSDLGGFALGLKAKKFLLDHELSLAAVLPAQSLPLQRCEAGIQKGHILSGSPFTRG